MQDESYENMSHHRLGSTGMLSAVTLNFLSYSVASENREYIQTATVTVAAFIVFFCFLFFNYKQANCYWFWVLLPRPGLFEGLLDFVILGISLGKY